MWNIVFNENVEGAVARVEHDSYPLADGEAIWAIYETREGAEAMLEIDQTHIAHW